MNTRDMYHAESVAEHLLFEITKAGIGYFLERPVAKHFEKGLVVNCDN